jgi:hypothetical protein
MAIRDILYVFTVLGTVLTATAVFSVIWNQFSYYRSLKAIARHFNGKVRTIPFARTTCRFLYESIPTMVAIVPGGRGGPGKLVLNFHESRFLFRAYLTRNTRGATFHKRHLWGPFSERIQTGIPELDGKLIIYTKQERDVTDYLANASVRDIVTNLVDGGWQDLYFTLKGLKIEKESPSAADLRPDNIRVTLDRLCDLLRSY